MQHYHQKLLKLSEKTAHCSFDLLLIHYSRKLLKEALEIATQSSDNHLRALILALLSNLYLLTASEHAQLMLRMCRQLAAGLGAPVIRSEPDQASEAENAQVVGNAPLGLWVGERFVGEYDIYHFTLRFFHPRHHWRAKVVIVMFSDNPAHFVIIDYFAKLLVSLLSLHFAYSTFNGPS